MRSPTRAAISQPSMAEERTSRARPPCEPIARVVRRSTPGLPYPVRLTDGFVDLVALERPEATWVHVAQLPDR